MSVPRKSVIIELRMIGYIALIYLFKINANIRNLRIFLFLFFLDAFKKTIDTFGKINIVINNAGVMNEYLNSWELTIDLNFVS